ncbi:hypothetical protein E3P89_03726 [Wallemia ichthyophaga]|uniref:37S ribosomal protein mrp4, mitochondrial n=2 Tax=Wallemia ichthyophaga TaxID=245174 RepID=A0A4T0G528_WALIC|nr:uncharacterized protein J056_003806 [Wallemia ichthyophaga EXF-994]TIA95686.1 hypothetical protein E3P95_03580 [Wallemia ichthyophaga]EOR02130.1 hypothetical protein J056_003806 [Wallemia ichthyophaga EXF-994]TIA96707.1 hypothetical protein E3P94_03587 [Wallemia ichthyophaga]TIB08161.1 hypothetical protein E3P93_03589 [Wallemia ichthyophaga]TIB08636.1 hypothetical protein E3P90_03612 [Wallemia ichthyophaga]
MKGIVRGGSVAARTFTSSARRSVVYARDGTLEHDSNELSLKQRLIQKENVESLEHLGSTQNSSNAYKPWKTRLPTSQQPIDSLVGALTAAGAHLGHNHSEWNPSMRPYIYGTRHGQSIIDLEQTLVAIRRAAAVVRGVVERDGIVLFVGGKTRTTIVKRATERAAEKLEGNGFCVPNNWLPGTLTNRYRLLPGGKPEQPPPLPDLVVFSNPQTYPHALRECALTRVPTVGLMDSDGDPRGVTYAIPANDDSERAGELIINLLAEAGAEGLMVRRELEESRQKAQRVKQRKQADGA